MVDFIEAFNAGIEAAEAANRAKKEIDSVFEDLNHQLMDSTGGKIMIDRKEFEVSKSLFETISYSIAFPPIKKETYTAIVAVNPSIHNSPTKQLATWSMDRAGYPCKIRWKGKDFICEDKEGLELTLSDLLRDPIVGENIHMLLTYEATNPDSVAEQKEGLNHKS